MPRKAAIRSTSLCADFCISSYCSHKARGGEEGGGDDRCTSLCQSLTHSNQLPLGTLPLSHTAAQASKGHPDLNGFQAW
jgi:hypothetical protein